MATATTTNPARQAVENRAQINRLGVRLNELAAVLDSREHTSAEAAEFASLKARISGLKDASSAATEQAAELLDRLQLTQVADASRLSTVAGLLARLKQPDGDFAHFADFAAAVRTRSIQVKQGVPRSAMDPRINPLAAAPSTAGNEGSGADGGILTPPNFSQTIFSLSQVLAEPSLLDLCSVDELESGNSMMLPQDTAVPWPQTGGVQMGWAAELAAGTPSKPQFAARVLRLKKLMGLVAMSDELGTDAQLPADYLASLIAIKWGWLVGEAILFGSGAGVPLGCLTSPAAVTVAKDSGQATNTLSATNLASMLSRLPPGGLQRAVWLISPSAMPALLTLTLGNFPVFLPHAADGSSFVDAPNGKLLGRPVLWSQHCPGFSSQGDVALVDLSYYGAISRAGGLQMATSLHLYFDADATAYRFTFRMDGAPKLTAPITPPKSNVTLSPFVLLAAR